MSSIHHWLSRWSLLGLMLCGSGWVAVSAGHVSAQENPLIEVVPVAGVGEAEAIAAAVQGEYSGRARGWNGITHRFGLQVVALANNTFEGTLFLGGLPFDGWDRKTRYAVSGSLAGSQLRLNDTEGLAAIEIDGSKAPFAWLSDASGARCGGMVRVERRSSTLGREPVPGARLLFRDGSIHGLEGAKLTSSGNLAIGCLTSEPVGDFEMHLEFRLPFEPNETGQNRGNSGVYIQRRYEVQILDSFGQEPGADRCASLYRQRPPQVNASLPPGQWQTYDIQFRQARWNASGEKTEPAQLTLKHNGIVVHNRIEIETKTGAGQVEGPEPLPLLLQDHRNAVEYRNVWLKDR